MPTQPTGGGPQPPQENLTETGLSGLVKSLASGAGRILADTLSGGQAEQIFQKKEAENRATLEHDFRERISRGENLDVEDMRRWRSAGGSLDTIGGMMKEGMTEFKDREQFRQDLDNMHTAGMLDDDSYRLMGLALHSHDPAAMQMAQAMISSHMRMANTLLGHQLRTGEIGLRQQLQTGEHERQEGVKSREKAVEQERGHEERMGEIKYRQQLKDTSPGAKAKGKEGAAKMGAAAVKDVGSALSAIQTGSLKGQPIDTFDKAKQIVRGANEELYNDPYMTPDRALTDSGYGLRSPGGWVDSEQWAFGNGPDGAIAQAAEKKLIQQEDADKFNETYHKALSAKDGRTKMRLMVEAANSLPAPYNEQMLEQMGYAVSRLKAAQMQQGAAAAGAARGTEDDNDEGFDASQSESADSDESDEGDE